MNTNNIISTTEARKNIFAITGAVQMPGVHYVLTEKGQAKAVVLSASEFSSWQETLEVVAEVPDLKAKIKKAELDIKNGHHSNLDDIIKKYDVPSNSSPRSRKKNLKNS